MSVVDPQGHVSGVMNGELSVVLSWSYNTRYWADFEPNTRTNANDSTKPYQLPDYHLVNLGINYHKYFRVGNKAVGTTFFLNVNNIFDEWYIERGKDGADHTLNTFTGYWGQGRTCAFGVKVSL